MEFRCQNKAALAEVAHASGDRRLGFFLQGVLALGCGQREPVHGLSDLSGVAEWTCISSAVFCRRAFSAERKAAPAEKAVLPTCVHCDL